MNRCVEPAGFALPRCAALVLLAAVAAFRPAAADEIVLPSGILERNGPATFVYRLERPEDGSAILAVEWSDSYGRLVEKRRIAVTLARQRDIAFTLDLRRALARQNRLSAHLTFKARGATAAREQDVEQTFMTPPPEEGWNDYQVAIWQPGNAARYASLKTMGVSAAMILPSRGQPDVVAPEIGPIEEADLACYVENIATDFYAAYHRWFPDRPKNWQFRDAKARYQKNPLDPSAFVRDPSLSDPVWQQKIAARLAGVVRAYAPYRPLYYTLADEPGIAETGSFWDFDVSEASLSSMRRWLEHGYGSLAALNRQWGTSFASWDKVAPMTTDEALRLDHENFSAWADFKEWMDEAFAEAFALGTKAVHGADPKARAALEGGQIPGWGGYDYSRLSHAVDVMELYDYGDNLAIAQALNPDLVVLTTAFGTGPAEARRVWRELLRGTRGLILWDAKGELADPAGRLGARGAAAAPYLQEIRNGLGALLIASQRQYDPVVILYSPASQRVQWLLDRREEGKGWSARDVDSENGEDAWRAAMAGFAGIAADAGLQPRYISSQTLAKDGLDPARERLLLLPDTLALSAAEAAAIRRFVAKGGVVLADGAIGIFDGHGRREARSQLADLLPDHGGVTLGEAARRREFAAALRTAGIAPRLAVTGSDGKPSEDLGIYGFRNGAAEIVALQRLAAPSSARADKRIVKLAKPAFGYDVRAGAALGRSDRFAVTLDAVAPTFLAFSDRPLAPLRLRAPAHLHLGESATLRVGLADSSDPSGRVARIDVLNPAGEVIAPYSRNLHLTRDGATFRLPLALNDPAGEWTIRVRDILSGATATAAMSVSARSAETHR